MRKQSSNVNYFSKAKSDFSVSSSPGRKAKRKTPAKIIGAVSALGAVANNGF